MITATHIGWPSPFILTFHHHFLTINDIQAALPGLCHLLAFQVVDGALLLVVRFNGNDGIGFFGHSNVIVIEV